MTYRYNLPAVASFSNCEACTFPLRIRYRDTGTNQRVIVRLRAATLGADGVVTLYQFDSDGNDTNGTPAPANANANQTVNRSFTMPGDHLTHGKYGYFLEVEIQKLLNDGTSSPGFIGFAIN